MIYTTDGPKTIGGVKSVETEQECVTDKYNGA